MPVYITVLYIISGILMSLIGVFAARVSPRSIVNNILTFFTIAACGWMLSLYLGFYFAAFNETLSLISVRTVYGFGTLYYMLIPIFFYFFPKPFHTPYPKVITATYIAISLSILAIAVFTPYIYEAVVIVDGALVADVFGSLNDIFIGYIVFNFLTH